MNLLIWAGIMLGCSALLYQTLALLALFVWKRRQPRPSSTSLPPVSILKPLCGMEPHLYANLRSFCEQDYPCFEIIFGVQPPADAALSVARRLQSEFQHLHIHIVIQQGHGCINRKIGNLANMPQHASFDYLVISDSSTAVGSNYLRYLAAELNDEHTGVVTCLYRACPQDSFFFRLAALYMNASFTPSIMVGWMLGIRDMLSFAVWLGSYFGRSIHWRGRAFVLNHNGLIQNAEKT